MIVQYCAISYNGKEVRRMNVEEILKIVRAFFEAIKGVLEALGIKVQEAE